MPRNTALFIPAGNYGDLEPFISLAFNLLHSNTFHQIHLCTPSDLPPQIPHHPSLHLHPLPFSQLDIDKACIPTIITARLYSAVTPSSKKPDPLDAHHSALAAIIKKLVTPALPALHALAESLHPTLLLSNLLTAAALHTLSESLHIPLAVLQFQPLTPTAHYPYLMSDVPTSRHVAKTLAAPPAHAPPPQTAHLLTYQKLFHRLHQTSLPALNAFRHSLYLPPVTDPILYSLFSGDLPRVHVLNSYPVDLIPPTPTWPPTVHCLPSLANAYTPPAWRAEESAPATLRFLDASPVKPVCVSFGTMRVFDRHRAISRSLLAGLRQANVQRVVILKGKANLGPHRLSILDHDVAHWAQRHVLFTDETPPHAWLLPRCEAVVCAGSPDVLFAALHAGVPAVVAPLMCDQFFWARLIGKRRLGAEVEGGLRGASEGGWLEAVRAGLAGGVKAEARRMGAVVREKGDGEEAVAELLGKLGKEGGRGLADTVPWF